MYTVARLFDLEEKIIRSQEKVLYSTDKKTIFPSFTQNVNGERVRKNTLQN